MALIVQTCGVVGTLIAATVGVRSYVNSNKRAEEARKKEQETHDLTLKAQQQNLETRQAQLFLQLYHTYHEKDWVAALHDTIYYINFKDFDDWWQKYGPSNPEKFQSFDRLSHSWEGAGILVRRNLIDPALVADLVSEEFVGYWEKFGPIIKEFRKRDNNPHICENQEYMYNLIKEKHPGKMVFR
jgi:hypothetical protein